MNAELVFDGRYEHVVAIAQAAVFVDKKLRHKEQGKSPDTLRRVLESRKHQMYDVFGHLVVTPGNEDLGSRYPVMIAIRSRLRANCCKVRASLGFCEIHRAGPLSAYQFRQVELLYFIRCMDFNGFNSSAGQHRAQTQRQVGALPHFTRGGADQGR